MPNDSEDVPRWVVLASGSGTTFHYLVEAARRGELKGGVVGLVSNRATAGAVERAKSLQVPDLIVDERAFSDPAVWDRAVAEAISSFSPTGVVLAGFLRQLGAETIRRFSPNVVNLHPGPLPKYGGKGMYGLRVHQAIVNAGEATTAVTVHRVTAGYDEGPPLGVLPVPVRPGESAESLAERVAGIEKPFLVQVLNKLVNPAVQ